jgi:hypothetical protein
MPSPKNLASYEQFHSLLFDKLSSLDHNETLQWEFESYKAANYKRLRFYGYLRTVEATYTRVIEKEERKQRGQNLTLISIAEEKLRQLATVRGFGIYIDGTESSSWTPRTAESQLLIVRHRDAEHADFTAALLKDFMAKQDSAKANHTAEGKSILHQEIRSNIAAAANKRDQDLFERHMGKLNIAAPYNPLAPATTPAEAMADVPPSPEFVRDKAPPATATDEVPEYGPNTDPYA